MTHAYTRKILFTLALLLPLASAHAAGNAETGQLYVDPIRLFPGHQYRSQGGETIDTHRQLVWQRCSVGQQWQDNKGCVGSVKLVSEGQDLTRLAQGGWRIPTKEELQSLRDMKRLQREIYPNIDEITFPNMDPAHMEYWSDSFERFEAPAGGQHNFYERMVVNFGPGYYERAGGPYGLRYPVRLVRKCDQYPCRYSDGSLPTH